MVAGRPRQFRNAADKQKAYRDRKRQAELESEALRNSKQQELGNRIRDMQRLIGGFDVANRMDEYYPERKQVVMRKGYSYCPCRHLEVQAWGLNGRVCPRCRNTNAGAIEYFERQRKR